MAIQTNISVTKKESEYYKKLTVLDPTAQALPQGDGTIRISPFDDYIVFTLFDNTGEDGELEDTPIDLSNVGTLTLVFSGENDEIRIPNWTRVNEIDLSQGQVLFRIDKENSKKILSLDNKNFYISTRMEDPDGTSDETVLYTGTFLALTDAAQQSLTAKLEEQGLIYAKELAGLQKKIEELNTKIAEMTSTIEKDASVISALEASNLNLSNEVKTLSDELGSTEAELLLSEAAEAQLAAELQQKKRAQDFANVLKNQGLGNNKKFFQVVANNMENFK